MSYDNEDVECWLIDAGIGYRNRQGNFEYGISLDEADADVPDQSWGDDELSGDLQEQGIMPDEQQQLEKALESAQQ